MGLERRTPVAIIEPQEIMRLGLAEVVEHSEGYEVVFQGATAEAFLAWPEQSALLLIIDPDVPAGRSCPIALLHGHFPYLRQLALARKASVAGMRAATRSGAVGYLPLDAGALDLLAALDELRIQGQSFYRPLLIPCLSGTEEVPGLQLFDRDEKYLPILRLMAHPKEYCDAQIGDLVGLKASTVKTYRKHIHAALGVHSATAAVLKAISLGLITPPVWD